MKKKTLVLGLGVSGRAAAEFLLRQNKEVIGIDGNRSLLEKNEDLKRLQSQGLHVQHESEEVNWEEIELLVVSPGVPPHHPIYCGAQEQGIEMTGEAELALPHFRKPLVAVTGTNGKTTVTLLTEHVMKASGIKAKALGNVGDSLCSYLLEPGPEEVFVVELSSYQLETMKTPVFDAAVLLNITPDHLDRYLSMQAYAQAKFRLQFLLKKDIPFFVYRQAAEDFADLITSSHVQTFAVEQQADLSLDALLWLAECEKLKRHDRENALAAWILCQPFGISREQFCHALTTFCKPPHRIEFVSEIDGVHFYDDSKGTNIDAVIQAVKAMQGPVVLIAGGVDKGASYLLWKEPFLGKVKQIIAIGQAAPKIYRELHPYFNVKLTDSLASAVGEAAASAVRGDFVLLSPGCSSYDMFRDYAHRGKEFQDCVQLIKLRRGES